MAVLLPASAPGLVYVVPETDPILGAAAATGIVVVRAPRVSTDPSSTHHIPTTGQLYPRGDN